MLGEISRTAMLKGWIPVQITVNPSMLDDAIDQLNSTTEHLIERGWLGLTGISAVGFGISFKKNDKTTLGWRQKVADKLEELEKWR